MAQKESNLERSCLDCETWSSGSFCSNCGQKMELSESTGQFLLEALPGIASRDGRFGRTLKLLLLNPGKLTRRFHEGKRTRYLSPVGMLLSAIFILFTLPLVIGLLPGNKAEAQKARSELVASIQTSDADIAQRVRWISLAKGEERQELIDELDSEIIARNLAARIADEVVIPTSRYAELLDELDEDDEDENWLDRRAESIGEQWQKNPELKIISLRNTLIKYSWLLIPLSLPMMMLLMPGGYRNRFKHALFAGYSLSFMLFIVAILLSALALDFAFILLIVALGVVAMVHLFVQTKNAYRLTWLAGIGHYLAILLCAVIGLILFAFLLFLLNLI